MKMQTRDAAERRRARRSSPPRNQTKRTRPNEKENESSFLHPHAHSPLSNNERTSNWTSSFNERTINTNNNNNTHQQRPHLVFHSSFVCLHYLSSLTCCLLVFIIVRTIQRTDQQQPNESINWFAITYCRSRSDKQRCYAKMRRARKPWWCSAMRAHAKRCG